MTNATSEETRVPKMSGNAPNCSATGSHTLVVTKSRPNFPMASRAPFHSSSTRKSSSRGMVTAARVSRPRKTWSL
jgi:hypothetical protein